MAVRINTNISAIKAESHLSVAGRDALRRRERLASGLAVNSGRDSSARLTVSEGMRAEIGGLAQGTRNAERAVNLLQTAEGGMSSISDMLLRLRELATESSSDTLNDRNRESLDAEFAQIRQAIDRVARSTTYNDASVLNGFGNEVDADSSSAIADKASTGVVRIDLSGALSGTYRFTDSGNGAVTLSDGTTSQTVYLGVQLVDGKIAPRTSLLLDFDRLGVRVELAGSGVKGAAGEYVCGALDGHTLQVSQGTGGAFQLGSDAIPADRLEYQIADITAEGPVLDLEAVSVGTRNSGRNALHRIDAAIDRLARERGKVGAVINRIQYAEDFTTGRLEQMSNSESTVRDADYAWETARLARDEVLRQSSLAMMKQSRVPLNMVMNLLSA